MRMFQAQHVPAPRQVFTWPDHSCIDLEIGCGVGKHPITRAQTHPNRHIIALDRSTTRLDKMKQTCSRQEPPLSNVSIVWEDADRFLVHAVPDASVQHIFLLYPNPYPKAGQANKRWHRMPLMQRMLECLVPGGQVTIATNMAFYAQEACQDMTGQWGLTLQSKDQYIHTLPFEPRTHFEKKYLERGETLFDLVFKKNN